MLTYSRLLVLIATLLSIALGSVSAAEIHEDFASDPAARGWRVAGDPSLFHWDAGQQALAVTWDSRKTNSYFHRALGTVLSREDDFSLSFDVRLSDISVGINPEKPFTFQVAVGFLRLAAATNSAFMRGTGTDSPDLVEFDYFPDSGFGATVSPTIISSNMQFATSFIPVELTTNDLFHVAMTYTASQHAMITTMTRNGQALDLSSFKNAVLATNFTDFRVDHLAICSYSDAGQDPQFGGSVLAHGVVDNLRVIVPPPPVGDFSGGLQGGAWRGGFTSRTNWTYTLEMSADLTTWTAIPPAVPGTGTRQTVEDRRPVTTRAFYRLRAER